MAIISTMAITAITATANMAITNRVTMASTVTTSTMATTVWAVTMAITACTVTIAVTVTANMA